MPMTHLRRTRVISPLVRGTLNFLFTRPALTPPTHTNFLSLELLKVRHPCNGKVTQRDFPLNGAVNKRFCDVVVASYAGAHHKVAVMSRNTAYAEGMKKCHWNEEDLKPGVRVFEDIRVPAVEKAFVDHLLTFR